MKKTSLLTLFALSCMVFAQESAPPQFTSLTREFNRAATAAAARAVIGASSSGSGGELTNAVIYGSTSGSVTFGATANATFSGGKTITTDTGALALTTGAANGNISLTPHGTGYTLLGGNVGIGTVTPGAKLHVESNGAIASFDTATGALGYTGFLVNNVLKGVLQWNTTTVGGVGTEMILQNTQGKLHLWDSTSGGIAISSGNVGIGTTTPDGLLHVHSASAGTITPNANADDLIVENNGTAGISILTPDASIGYLVWGSPTAAVGAQVFYSHTSGILGFGTVKVGGILDIRADNNVANLTLSGASGSELASFVGNVKISKNTGGGIPAIQSLLNVFGGTTVGAGAPGILTLGNSGNVMTTGDILGSVDFYNNDASGSAAGVRSGMEGVIDSASGTGASLVFKTGIAATATEKARITSAGAFGIGTTAPDKSLEINSATGANLRLTYNDSNGSAAAFSDFSVSSGGVLTIAPTTSTTTPTSVLVTGKLATTPTSVTIAAAAATFAVASNVVTVTGDAGANTVTTITGGVSGQILTLIFADGLVTITDDAGGGANTINLSAAWTSSANDVMQLVFNGTSWREASRSVN